MTLIAIGGYFVIEGGLFFSDFALAWCQPYGVINHSHVVRGVSKSNELDQKRDQQKMNPT